MNERSFEKKELYSVYMCAEIYYKKTCFIRCAVGLFFLLLLIFKNHLYAVCVCVCARSLCVCPLMNNVAKERTLTSYKTLI